MKKNILYCIVVHDPNIINYFESKNKYKSLKNYIYLLVGNHKDDFNSKKVIQCNKILNNIENQKNFLAYTAWFLLANNIHLIPNNCDYVCLLEYDVEIMNEEDVEKFENYIYSNKHLIYGIDKMFVQDCFLERSIFSNILENFLIYKKYKEIKANNKYWIVSNNVVFDKNFLKKYINDKLTKEFFNFLKNDKMSGHNLERFLTIYCFIKKIKYNFIEPKLFNHVSLDSHNTQNKLKYDEYIKNV